MVRPSHAAPRTLVKGDNKLFAFKDNHTRGAGPDLSCRYVVKGFPDIVMEYPVFECV